MSTAEGAGEQKVYASGEKKNRFWVKRNVENELSIVCDFRPLTVLKAAAAYRTQT